MRTRASTAGWIAAASIAVLGPVAGADPGGRVTPVEFRATDTTLPRAGVTFHYRAPIGWHEMHLDTADATNVSWGDIDSVGDSFMTIVAWSEKTACALDAIRDAGSTFDPPQHSAHGCALVGRSKPGAGTPSTSIIVSGLDGVARRCVVELHGARQAEWAAFLDVCMQVTASRR